MLDRPACLVAFSALPSHPAWAKASWSGDLGQPLWQHEPFGLLPIFRLPLHVVLRHTACLPAERSFKMRARLGAQVNHDHTLSLEVVDK